MWPVDRREELNLLIRLFNECLRINSATNVVDRLTRIIEFAEILTKTDFIKPRVSFLTFVVDEAKK